MKVIRKETIHFYGGSKNGAFVIGKLEQQFKIWYHFGIL